MTCYRKWHFTRTLCTVFVLTVLSGSLVNGQSLTDGAIGGQVTDPQKAGIPGATVLVRNPATNASAEATSDGNGRFLVIRLQPGTYSVEVMLAGFAPYKRDVIVEIGRATNLDIGLGVAGQVETVQVTAETPVVNTEQSDLSTNINQTAIANLPTNTRRWSTFALSAPGAAPDGSIRPRKLPGHLRPLEQQLRRWRAITLRHSFLKSAGAHGLHIR